MLVGLAVPANEKPIGACHVERSTRVDCVCQREESMKHRHDPAAVNFGPQIQVLAQILTSFSIQFQDRPSSMSTTPLRCNATDHLF